MHEGIKLTTTDFNEVLIRRTSLIISAATLILLLIRLNIAELHFIGLTVGIVMVVLCATISYIAGRYISVRSASWVVCIAAWLALSVAGYLAGGLKVPVIVVFPLLPLLSSLLINNRAATIIGILSCLTILVLVLLDIYDRGFPSQQLNTEQEAILRGLWMIFTISLIMVIGWFYNKGDSALHMLLRSQADSDHLTGLANRRKLEETLEREFHRIHRTGSWLTLLIIDIDQFKQVNDNYGHLTGDRCLVRIAEELNHHCRRSLDLAGRYGGEEFMIILPETPPQDGYFIAEKLRQAIATLHINTDRNEDQYVTVTIGCASIRDRQMDTTEELVLLADKLLYQGKDSGRNTVISNHIN